mgnify:CR=1 FL=1
MQLDQPNPKVAWVADATAFPLLAEGLGKLGDTVKEIPSLADFVRACDNITDLIPNDPVPDVVFLGDMDRGTYRPRDLVVDLAKLEVKHVVPFSKDSVDNASLIDWPRKEKADAGAPFVSIHTLGTPRQLRMPRLFLGEPSMLDHVLALLDRDIYPPTNMLESSRAKR